MERNEHWGGGDRLRFVNWLNWLKIDVFVTYVHLFVSLYIVSIFNARTCICTYV